MGRFKRAVGVLSSLLIISSCVGGGDGAREQSSMQPMESVAVGDTIPSGARVFVIDSLSEDKLGRIDLGTIGEGEMIEGSFYIRNGLSEPLSIHSMRGTCGCLSPHIDGKPILSGGSREATYYYDSRGKSGRQIVAIVLRSSSGRYRLELDVMVRSAKN